MRKFLRIFIFFIFFVLVFGSAVTTTVQAQTPSSICLDPTKPCGQTPAAQQLRQEATSSTESATTSTTSPCGTGTISPQDQELAQQSSTAPFTTAPSAIAIDETLPCVDITFHGVTPGTKYFLCTGDNSCLGQDKVSSDFVLTDKGQGQQADSDGNVTFRVCGDGDNSVKVNGCSPDGNNFFHGGQIYFVSLVNQTNQGKYQPIIPGGFYVSKYYPTVYVQPNTNLQTSSTSPLALSVGLYGKALPGGEIRNNYQITLHGSQGDSAETCTTIGTTSKFEGLKDPGTYVISIKEQINDQSLASKAESGGGGLFGGFVNGLPGVSQFNELKDTINTITHPRDIPKNIAQGLVNTVKPIYDIGKAGVDIYNTVDNQRNDCQGGFVYYQITCDVTLGAPGGKCTDPNQGKDPKGQEYRAFLKAVNALNGVDGTIQMPCGFDANKQVFRSTNCPSVDTAIGRINVINPESFILDMFKFALGIAAFVGVIMILISGYIMMTSSGNKEKVAGAKDMLVAAITGLLFIILSIVILEIIGVDILRLPGFGRGTATPTTQTQTR